MKITDVHDCNVMYKNDYLNLIISINWAEMHYSKFVFLLHQESWNWLRVHALGSNVTLVCITFFNIAKDFKLLE